MVAEHIQPLLEQNTTELLTDLHLVMHIFVTELGHRLFR